LPSPSHGGDPRPRALMAWFGGEEAPALDPRRPRSARPAELAAAAEPAKARDVADAPAARLRNGLAYPMIGLGCASGVREEHVLAAIQQGYRLLDTAAAYEWGYREDEVGRALTRSGLRSEVFVQTKVRTPRDSDVRAAVEACMTRLQAERLDAVLLHKPEGDWLAAWAAMEGLYRQGLVRAIGASDLSEAKLLQLLAVAEEPPMILQNWFEPFHQDGGVRALCRQHGIVYQSFSALGTQWPMILKQPRSLPNPVRNHPVLRGIAARHGCSVPQVILSWALSEGVATVPASRSEEHRRDNLSAPGLKLDEEDLRLIRTLDGATPLVAAAPGSEGCFPPVD